MLSGLKILLMRCMLFTLWNLLLLSGLELFLTAWMLMFAWMLSSGLNLLLLLLGLAFVFDARGS